MKKIYDKMPYFIRVFLVNLYGIKNNKIKWNSDIRNLIPLYYDADFKKRNVHGFTFYEDGGISENKALAKNNFKKILNKKKFFLMLSTSGTSGSGFNYPVSKKYLNNLWAVYWKFRSIHGIDHNDWFMYFIGKEILPINKHSQPYWIKSYTTKQLLFSQYHLNESTVELYLDEMIKSKIKCLHAYPSTLLLLCNLIVEKKLQAKVNFLNLKFISVSSERLIEQDREKIQGLLNCKVYQIYGTTEGVINAFECENQKLHIDESFSYVELIKKENKFEVVGSSYHNECFPLVRYHTGDLVELDHEPCSCGRKNRIIKTVFGRQEDYLLLPNGTKIGRLDHIFKELTNIMESQIIQNKDLSLNILIVPSEDFSDADRNKLYYELNSRFKDILYFEVNVVNKIPRTKSGKLRAVISNAK